MTTKQQARSLEILSHATALKGLDLSNPYFDERDTKGKVVKLPTGDQILILDSQQLEDMQTDIVVADLGHMTNDDLDFLELFFPQNLDVKMLRILISGILMSTDFDAIHKSHFIATLINWPQYLEENLIEAEDTIPYSKEVKQAYFLSCNAYQELVHNYETYHVFYMEKEALETLQ